VQIVAADGAKITTIGSAVVYNGTLNSTLCRASLQAADIAKQLARHGPLNTTWRCFSNNICICFAVLNTVCHDQRCP
jgi:hypothetical protein